MLNTSVSSSLVILSSSLRNHKTILKRKGGSVLGKILSMNTVAIMNRNRSIPIPMMNVMRFNYHSCTKNITNKQSQKENYSSMLLSKLYQVCSKGDREQTIDQIKNDLFTDTLDQDKTRNILKQLDCLETEDFKQILDEYIKRNSILPSMKAYFSHKILIRLYDGLSVEDKTVLLEHCIFNQDLLDICTGKYSSATVRELVSRMSDTECDRLIKLFTDDLVLEISKDVTGTFLISKLIQMETHKKVMRMAERNFSVLIVHPIGNYVVQECLKRMNDIEHVHFINIMKQDFKHIASTQQGSIVLKEFLTAASDKVVDYFFSSVVLPDMKGFSTTKHATPILEIIFDRIGTEQKRSLVEKLSLITMDVIFTTHGSIFVQKMIEKFTNEQLEVFLQAIKPKIKPIIEGESSSFVMSALFIHSNKYAKKEIINALKPYVLELSLNKNSSRVIQHILTNCERSDMDSFVLLLLSNFEHAVSNEASSPIFQMIIQRGFGESVFLRMKGTMEKFASHHIGSYVVSNCLKNCKKSITDQMLLELLVDDGSIDKISDEKVINLLKTKSGSFVMLDCLNLVIEKYSNQALYGSLTTALHKHVGLTKNNALKKKLAGMEKRE